MTISPISCILDVQLIKPMMLGGQMLSLPLTLTSLNPTLSWKDCSSPLLLLAYKHSFSLNRSHPSLSTQLDTGSGGALRGSDFLPEKMALKSDRERETERAATLFMQ